METPTVILPPVWDEKTKSSICPLLTYHLISSSSNGMGRILESYTATSIFTGCPTKALCLSALTDTPEITLFVSSFTVSSVFSNSSLLSLSSPDSSPAISVLSMESSSISSFFEILFSLFSTIPIAFITRLFSVGELTVCKGSYHMDEATIFVEPPPSRFTAI